MKEATGEVSMTVIVIVAIAVISGILAVMWPRLRGTIENSWGNTGREACESGGGNWVCTNQSCTCNMPR